MKTCWRLTVPVLILVLLGNLFPQKASAELVTGKDWVGLFVSGAPDDRPAGNAWQYVGCSQTSGLPFLERSAPPCNFTTPNTPGAYEAKMLANDSCASDPSKGCTRLATSNVGWVGFNLNTPTTDCTLDTNLPYVNLSWPSLNGVKEIEIYRDGSIVDTITLDPLNPSTTTYQDATVQPSTSYTYSITAYAAQDGFSYPSNDQTITSTSCGPKISSMSIINSGDSGSFTSSKKASGRQAVADGTKSGKNWYNPITIQLTTKASSVQATFYVALYDKALAPIQPLQNPATFLSSVQSWINQEPKNGILLAYDTGNNYYVWDNSIIGVNKWAAIPPIGFYPVCGLNNGNKDCINKPRYRVARAPGNSWQVSWDTGTGNNGFGSKVTYTAAYARDTNGLEDFNPNYPNP